MCLVVSSLFGEKLGRRVGGEESIYTLLEMIDYQNLSVNVRVKSKVREVEGEAQGEARGEVGELHTVGPFRLIILS